MLDDAFKIVLDPIFTGAKHKNYPVTGYKDKFNMWIALDNIQIKTGNSKVLN